MNLVPHEDLTADQEEQNETPEDLGQVNHKKPVKLSERVAVGSKI